MNEAEKKIHEERKVDDERAWQESISVPEHKMFVDTLAEDFAKPAININRADKKPSVSSLKDLFTNGKKEQGDKVKKPQAFVMHKAYNHNDEDVSKLLPPPIKGAITPQGTRGLMSQTLTTGPLTTGTLTIEPTGLSNQSIGQSHMQAVLPDKY